MTDGVCKYRRSVKRLLLCGGDVRSDLIARMDKMLTSFQSENPAPSFEELAKSFGTPEEMAQELMLDITPEEQETYCRKRRTVRIIACAAVALALIFVVYVGHQFCALNEIEATHTVYVYETNPD